MGYIARFFLALLNLLIPTTDRDLQTPAVLVATRILLPTVTTPATATGNILPAVATPFAPNIFNIFALDPTGWDPTPRIHASVMRVDISRSQTEYWVTCDLHTMIEFKGPSPPCNFLDGVSVTINPTEMMLDIRRETNFGSFGYATINGTRMITVQRTSIIV